MTLKTIKSVIRNYRVASCGRKKRYTLINVILRWIELKCKKVNVNIYKCEFGNHYHVGRYNKITIRRKRRYNQAVYYNNMLQHI